MFLLFRIVQVLNFEYALYAPRTWGLRAVGSGHPLRPLVFSAFASILLISLASHKDHWAIGEKRLFWQTCGSIRISRSGFRARTEEVGKQWQVLFSLFIMFTWVLFKVIFYFPNRKSTIWGIYSEYFLLFEDPLSKSKLQTQCWFIFLEGIPQIRVI